MSDNALTPTEKYTQEKTVTYPPNRFCLAENPGARKIARHERRPGFRENSGMPEHPLKVTGSLSSVFSAVE
jgi:hypothetical protein